MNYFWLHKYGLLLGALLCLSGGLFALELDRPSDDPMLEAGPLSDLDLESSPTPQTEDWEVFYLKASYRQSYRLKAVTSQDRWSVPLAGELVLSEDRNDLINQYTADSKIYVNDQLSSYLRFDYFFQQSYQRGSKTYSDAPHVVLHEAYMEYQSSGWSGQVGGLLMPLGRVDFENPLDVLNLKDPDRSLHLEPEDQRLIMAAVKLKLVRPETTWQFYWGPFQRLSEEASSVRANLGLVASSKGGDFQWDAGVFKWLDPDGELTLKFQPTLEDPDQVKPSVVATDSPLHFGFFSFDVPSVGGLIKGDMGLFKDKTYYHIRLVDDGSDLLPQSELDSLHLPTAAVALSYEQRRGDFFWMPSVYYTQINQAPAGSLIYGFENRETPLDSTHNLSRAQVALVLGYQIAGRWEVTALGFGSAPYRRSGTLLSLQSQGARASGWKIRASQVNTEVDLSTKRATQLQRITVSWTTKM